MQDRILGVIGWARGRTWRVAVLTLLLWGMVTAGAAPGGIDEYRVKAAFLYSFCKFVSWPDRAGSGAEQPFVIGVVGDPLKAAVISRELEGKRIGERPVVVREFNRLQDVRDVRVAYLSVDEMARQRRSRRDRLERDAVLTVGDGPGFLQAGGMVALEVREARLVFGVNLGPVRRAGLEMSANLLLLAAEVLDH